MFTGDAREAQAIGFGVRVNRSGTVVSGGGS
jgi:hypothetical protein